MKKHKSRTPVTICVSINKDFATRLRDEARVIGRIGGVSRLVEDIIMSHYSRIDAQTKGTK